MIKLEIEKYCHDCLSFEAEVESPTLSIYGEFGDTIIKCKKHQFCGDLYCRIQKIKGE